MRRKGQHFLIDRAIVDRIAGYAELKGSDTVLEIGPGTGFLTEAISPRVKQVYAIEVDPDLALGIAGRFPNARIIQGDALKVDFPCYNKIVSNLPYQISSKITYRLLSKPFELAVLMYQKEFAMRMLSGPGMPGYGRLSVITGHYARAEIMEYVPRSAFRPEPHIDSAIVKLWPRPDKAIIDDRFFIRLVTGLFGNRRKKLMKALAASGVSKEIFSLLNPALLEERPDKLSIGEIESLALEVSSLAERDQ